MGFTLVCLTDGFSLGLGPQPPEFANRILKPSRSEGEALRALREVTMPYFRLFYHMIWGTKNREPLVQTEFELSLHNVIAAKGKELGAFVYAVDGIEDHIHLVASVPPRIALADFIGQVKGNSSHWVNHELSLPYQFSWQAEYGVVSFGGKQLDMVVKYVKNQRQHHLAGTIIPFLERVEAKEARG